MYNKTKAIDKVNPVTQVLCVLICGTPLLASIDVVSAAVELSLIIVVSLLFVDDLKDLVKKSLPLLVLAPLFSLSLLLYAKPVGTIYLTWGPFIISAASINLSLATFLRILALSLPAVLVFTRIDPTLMADGLTQILKLPSRPVIASLSALRMIHLMAHDWRYLGYARRTRAVSSKGAKGMLDSAFALLFFALRRAAKLSTTMEARGFGSEKARSYARPSSTGMWDAVALAIAVLIPTISISAAIFLGTFRPLGI